MRWSPGGRQSWRRRRDGGFDARASLAADVPPALLADKLGLSIGAAVFWSKAVGSARADYPGLRYAAQRT
jgi:hypothetical protein